MRELGTDHPVPIQAVGGRSKDHPGSTIRTGKLVVNLDTRVVSVDDQPVPLTGKEYAILELLSLRKDTILTKEMFLNHLYLGWLLIITCLFYVNPQGCPRSKQR